MERLRERLIVAQRALGTLKELVDVEAPDAIIRDAAIQRFEYSFEATWKAAQRFLQVVEGLTPGSPKACIRASRDAGLIDDEMAEAALSMVDDRNLTVPTYNEALAQIIHSHLPGHVETLGTWIQAMSSRIDA